MVDPTFLLTGEDYGRLEAKRRLRDHPFIFFLWYLHEDQMLAGAEFANTIARKYHLPIVYPFVERPPYLFAKDGGCMMYEGIENFLWYIQNAKIIDKFLPYDSIFHIFQKTILYLRS